MTCFTIDRRPSAMQRRSATPGTRGTPWTVAALSTCLLGVGILAASTPAAVRPLAAVDDDPRRGMEMVESVRHGLVRVEHHLRQHQGERPESFVSGDPFSIGGGGARENADALIGDERPLEGGGYLLEPTLVMTMDIGLHDRFVDRIRVRFGNDVVDATIESWAVDDVAIFLRLARPLEGAEPLAFAAEGGAASWSVRWMRSEGSWIAESRPFVERLALVDQQSNPYWRTTTAPGTLMLDDEGRVVGATIRGSYPRDRAILGDPRTWPRLDRDGRRELLERTARRADEVILLASLQFRSPRQRGGQRRFSPYRSDGDGVGTELITLALKLGDGRVAILAALPPSATARLESITLHSADGGTTTASFESTLRDLGVLTATVDAVTEEDATAPDESIEPSGAILASTGLLEWRDRLLPTALVRISGRQRLADRGHVRFERFTVGWRGVVFATMIPEVDRTFVFSPEGTVVALPLVRRVVAADRDRWRGVDWTLMPASLLAATLDAGDEAIDASNIPLSEDEESRSAWLGATMQELDPDLADALGVADVTMDGQFGGLVTAVYDDSPAARAGVEAGTVVLAIHSASRPRPIQIVVDESDMGYPGAFPWERLDEVPEEFFDQIPTPWPTIEDLTSTILMELGFGTPFELEVFVDGEVRRLPMVVEQSPPHYGNAARHEEERLGITVRDLSFEIRAHLRIADDEPGVVIANLKPGGRASLAGLRPFEIITEVDGNPVADAAEFGRLVEGRTELRLAVRRGTRSRVVRLSDAP